MNKKQIINKDEKIKLLEGVEILYNSVSSTLGPGGRNVVIEDDNNDIQITKDGVTVAKSITVENTIHDLAIRLIKQAANDVNDATGDGTTTATVLAYELLKSGNTYMNFEKLGNTIEVQRGINKAVEYVIELIEKHSKDISTNDQIEQVALVSSNNDKQIAKLLSKAIKEVSRDGIITVEDSKSTKDEFEVVSGLQFKRGFASHYFITNNNTQEVVLKDSHILLYDGKISYAKQLVPLLEKIVAKQESLLIIADDIEGEALGTLIINKLKGNAKVAACRAAEFGQKRKQFFKDVAVLTGGTVIDPNAGFNLEKFDDISLLGKSRKVEMTKEQTTIIDGKGTPEEIKEQANVIKNEIENAETEYAKNKLKERLANLVNGVAIIRIAAETELELRERKDRLEDALNATKAAVEKGILPGGGIALLRIKQEEYTESKIYKDLPDAQKVGFKILINILDTPFNKIISNAHANPPSILEKISNEKFEVGYDVRNEQIGSMYELGIIDPTKVVKTALQKAASIAGIFLTADTFILNVPKEENDTLPAY